MALQSPRPLPKDASEEDLVRLANIVTGRYLAAQPLDKDHLFVRQLEPYSKWLYNHLRFHQTDHLDAINWFENTVTFFSNDPDGRINKFLDDFRPLFPEGKRDKFMRNLVLSFLSYWLTIDLLHKILDNIQETAETINHCVVDLDTISEWNKEQRSEEDIRAGNISAKELVYNGRLIPRVGTYTDPLRSINQEALNAHHLFRYGRLKVKWTTDVSRHLEIDETERILYLFCMPCLFGVQLACSSTKAVQAFRTLIPEQYTDEICRSYWLLFNQTPRGRKSFKQALKGDPEINVADEKILKDLCIVKNEMSTVWARDNFVYLWPRILALKSHLEGQKPEDLWGTIWHDRRKPMYGFRQREYRCASVDATYSPKI